MWHECHLQVLEVDGDAALAVVIVNASSRLRRVILDWNIQIGEVLYYQFFLTFSIFCCSSGLLF